MTHPRANRRRPLRVVTALLGPLLLAGLSAPSPSRADCSLSGSSVTCSGDDPDGFDAGVANGLDIDIESGATVSNPAGDAIRLNDESSVVARGTSSVTASSPGAGAIVAGSGGNLGSITIQNGATITSSGANGSAIAVGDDWDDITRLGVSNSGTINLTGDDSTAISVGARSRVINENSGAITLSGANSTGISGGLRANLQNLGTIGATGPGATGMRITTIGRLTHSGTIDLTGDDATGLDIGNLNILVTSNGPITINGDRGTGIRLGDDNDRTVENNADLSVTGADGIGIQTGDRNTLLNSDRISVTDPTDLTGTGVLLGADNDFTNNGTLEVNAANGIGVLLDGVNNGVTNSGTLTATTAIESTFGRHNILNTGTITGDIRLGDGGQTVDNFGTLTGDIIVGDGNDIVTNGTILEGNVALGGGDDTLRIDGVSSSTGTFDGGAEVTADRVLLGATQQGTLDLDTVSNFEALEVQSGAWTLVGTGDFSTGTTVRSLATLAVDGSGPTGATHLVGDLQLEDGSTLRTTIDPDGDQGHLVVDGAVTTAGTVVLDIVALAPTRTTASFELISADSIGSFQLPTLSDTAFLDFQIIQSATDLDFIVTRSSSYEAVGDSVNQRAVGANLDAVLAAGPTGDMASLLTEIDQLSADGARTAFDSLQPEAYDAHASTVLSLGSAIADLVTADRLRCDREYRFELRGRDSEQPNPCGAGGRGLWATALVSFASRDTHDSRIDFDSSGGAFLVGGNLELEDWFVSGFLGGTLASIDVKTVGDGDSYSFELGGLARRSFGGARIETVALYGHGWHQQERAIRTGAPRAGARGRFQSNRFLSRTELAYVFELAGFEFSPLTQLEYVYLGEDGFREKRAAGAALRVAERRTSVLRSGFGARLAYEGLKYYWLGRWFAWTDGTWRGEIHGRWLRTWKGDQRNLHASFVEAPTGVGSFRSAAQDVEQAMTFGGRVTFQPLRYAATISAGYDFQLGDATTEHRGTAELRIPF